MFKKAFLILAMLMSSTVALATPPWPYLVKSVSCASGELNTAQAPAQAGKITTIGYIAMLAAKANTVVVENGRDAAVTLMVDGSENSACNNGGTGTLLTIVVSQ